MRQNPFSRRGRIRLISYGLALITLLGVLATDGWTRAYTYQLAIEYEYQQAFSQLCAGVEGIDATLTKGLYATSPGLTSALSAEVARQAADAGAALSRLPFAFEELENTARFLSRVGDYSNALVKLAAYGQRPSEQDAKNLEELAAAARQLALELATLQSVMEEEQLKIGTVLTGARSAGAGLSPAAMDMGFFKDLESEFPEFPSLIYDGPFSAHLDTLSSSFLRDKPEFTAEEAQLAAADFLSVMPEALALIGESGDILPVYTFAGLIDGGELSIEVTRDGGYVLQLVHARPTSGAELSSVEAVRLAGAFLKKNGFDRMIESYWERYDNTLTVNFSCLQEDVVCYSDLIKVGVALDTGKITGFEAHGYLLNHRQRPLQTVKVSAEDARRNLSSRLTVIGYRQALIPTAGAREIHCHEFICQTKDGQNCLVYVNTETGQEERILLLIMGEEGTLAM